jgi:hypothetical protein
MDLVKEISLENGVNVCFYSHAHRYFGDYYRLKLDIVCEAPLLEEYFADRQAYAEASASLGPTAIHRRNVEQMGVPSAEVDRTLESLIEHFSRHSLPYIASSTYPKKLVLTEVKGAGRKIHRAYAG